MKITEINVNTTGLYTWGKGFRTKKQADGWDTFWRNHTGNFWHAYLDSVGSVFLSTTYGGGMIHPMDFKLVLRQEDVEARSKLVELDRILHHLAQTLGFTYRLKVRGHVVPDNETDWRLFSTEKGVATAVPGRIGVQEARDEEVDPASEMTCGKPPYVAEIVRASGTGTLWTAPVRYRSEHAAEIAIIQRATQLKHRCSGLSRHWITGNAEHVIDYGSHFYYGRIMSVENWMAMKREAK